MRSQALAIAMVIGSGVATFVMSLSTLDSLRKTRDAFYRDYNFADAFVSLERAPESIALRLADIPGVARVETRVNASVKLDIAEYPDPATALIVSYDPERTQINKLYLRAGRLMDPLRDDEAVVSEAFAEAHHFQPGDHLDAIINGRRKRLRLVGVALSPEFVLQIPAASIVPDFHSYGILWMARKPLATAYDMDGAFNNATMRLTADAQIDDVLSRVDDVLARYGGLGSHGRKDQPSHRYLSEEFRQLESMATFFPIIFLSVAAFLLNVVLSRLIQTQRELVATLKAFGYSNGDVAIHYLEFASIIACIGVALGFVGGIWLGEGLSGLYAEFYRFPFLLYELDPSIALWALALSLAAAFAGTLYSVYKAASQAPAEAMRPEPPGNFRRTFVERLGLGDRVSEATRMILRNVERRPMRALLTSVGVAASYSILVLGLIFQDSIDYMLDVQFRLTERQDMTVSFTKPTSRRSLYDLEQMPGVFYGEPYRAVPVRFRNGRRTYRTIIQGYEPGGRLYRTLDANLQVAQLPSKGLVMTDYLANLLGLEVGDVVTTEILEGERPVREVPLAGVVSQFLGVSGYMDIVALNRLMHEGRALSGVYLAVDPLYEKELYRRLENMPRVAGTQVQRKALRSLKDTMGEQILMFAAVATALAGAIAFGVIYNSARVALSERGRDLASLRVLGFTRAEASHILLGELALLTLLGLPLGVAMGRVLAGAFVQTWQSELFRVPLVISTRTYSYAGLIVLACAAVSAWIVRRRINHLDLIEALKTRE
ncbi:MAG: ABC transporter permease [Bryobacterales bacterium]